MKKIIEVALPLEAINVASAREKSIRHGHPSTLHLWWARRPLAACRAVLFSSLVDDPGEYISDEAKAHEERQRLFRIIEELVKWENSNNEDVLDRARLEIARSVARNLGVQPPIGTAAVREFLAEKAPPVLDPFAGGGSIPLEAQRLGLRAYASDLNPVAVLINKALIEIPPRFAGQPPVHPPETMTEGRTVKRQKRGAKAKGVQLPLPTEWKGAAGLAEDVRYYGQWMRDEAEKRIGHLYPKVKLPPEYGGGEATVIAWLWARNVKCPNPACGATMPLVRSFALSTKKGKQAWVEPVIDRISQPPQISFNVKTGSGTPPEGTVNRRGARCIACGTPVPFEHVRAEGKAGRMGAQLMTIVAEGKGGRVCLPPNDEHAVVAASAQPEWAPETDLPERALSFRVQLYGMTKHRDLFTSRQLVALTTFSDLVSEVRLRAQQDTAAAGLLDDDVVLNASGIGAMAYADAVATYLGEAVSKLTAFHNTLAYWRSKESKSATGFGRQALAMTWDYIEVNPFANAGGDFQEIAAKALPNVISSALPAAPQGWAKQNDVMAGINHSEPLLISTDPPYYDNVGYADLSDVFYTWLRKSIGKVYPGLFSTVLVPKAQELIATPYRFGGDREKAQEFFEQGLSKAFANMRSVQDLDYPLTVFYAFKQVEVEDNDEDGEDQITTTSTGWETMLEGLLSAGFSITGTWPMRTENKTRMLATGGGGSNALASSIVLVCRPRPEDASLATRRDFLAELKKELPAALRELQQGNIAPVDLAQAAIGPGMAVYSRYRQVLEADGSPMRVRAALALINQALDEYLTEQEGEYDADTRWALAWFEQYGQESGPYGVAETLSKAKNTSPEGLVRAGILESRAGQVRLLRREELRAEWDPRADERPTAWEATQYLIRSLDQGGEQAAAALLARLGSLAESARDLAYRLYTICERKNWAQEALGYNMLVVAWPRLVEMASRQEYRQDSLV
jgi:putative DNA methylase